jgi:hypothetical protein
MINKEINKLFKPALDRIEKVKNCNHIWPDKNGSAYYICSKCDISIRINSRYF